VAAVLARLHEVDYAAYPQHLAASHLGRWAALSDLPANTAAFVGYWRERAQISRIGPSPLVRRALDWLKRNVPQDAEGDAPVMLHGDIGLHNMLIDEGRVSAILDWEISRIGDRAEEITNFLTATGDVIAREDFFRWYEQAGGRPVSEYRLRYFDVYHSVKMAICALAVLRRIEENRGAAIALAVFGLQYLHFITSRLTGLIRLAEEARAA
jgi:aminoglycoside phosphotransferase (APT) family kinase protein